MNRTAASEPACAATARSACCEAVEEQDTVRQAGERVVQRPVLDCVLGRLSLERVGEHIRQGLDERDVTGRVVAWRLSIVTPNTPNGPSRPSITTAIPLRIASARSGAD